MIEKYCKFKISKLYLHRFLINLKYYIMTSKQESKLKMYLTVRIFLKSNPAILAKLPNCDEFMADLDAAITQIQNSSEQGSFSTKGVTDNKQELRDNLTMLIVDNSAKIQAYARYAHDTVLLAETKFKNSEVRKYGALELVDSAKGLHTRIQSNLDKLTDYTLTAATQTAFREAIDAFADSIPQPRQSQLKSKENTLLEVQAFADADAALSNIDTLMEIVKRSESNFYTGYKNARKIVDQGTGSLQVQGTVIEAETKKPIPVATVTFRLSGQTEVVLEKETAAKGGFVIKSLPEAIYDVTVSKVGFKDKTISPIVRWDELCNVEVELEKV